MTLVTYTKDQLDIVWAQQATWGTAIADNAAIAITGGATGTYGSILDVEATQFDPDAKQRFPDTSNSGYRWLSAPAYQLDYKGSVPSFSIVGDVKLNELPMLLYSVLQNVSEGATTPYAKTYTLTATQPDFTANAGMFMTFWEVVAIASKHHKIKDVICKKLTLTVDPSNGFGRMRFQADFVGRGLPTANTPASFWTANRTGTQARSAETFFYFHDIVLFQAGGVDLNPGMIKYEFSNNAEPVSVDTARLAEFKGFVLGSPSWDIKATYRCLWDTNAEALRDDIGTEGVVAWVLRWGNATPGTVTGDLQVTHRGQVLKSPMVFETLNMVDFEVTGVYDGTTLPAANPLTIILADGVDRAW